MNKLWILMLVVGGTGVTFLVSYLFAEMRRVAVTDGENPSKHSYIKNNRQALITAAVLGLLGVWNIGFLYFSDQGCAARAEEPTPRNFASAWDRYDKLIRPELEKDVDDPETDFIVRSVAQRLWFSGGEIQVEEEFSVLPSPEYKEPFFRLEIAQMKEFDDAKELNLEAFLLQPDGANGDEIPIDKSEKSQEVIHVRGTREMVLNLRLPVNDHLSREELKFRVTYTLFGWTPDRPPRVFMFDARTYPFLEASAGYNVTLVFQNRLWHHMILQVDFQDEDLPVPEMDADLTRTLTMHYDAAGEYSTWTDSRGKKRGHYIYESRKTKGLDNKAIVFLFEEASS